MAASTHSTHGQDSFLIKKTSIATLEHHCELYFRLLEALDSCKRLSSARKDLSAAEQQQNGVSMNRTYCRSRSERSHSDSKRDSDVSDDCPDVAGSQDSSVPTTPGCGGSEVLKIRVCTDAMTSSSMTSPVTTVERHFENTRNEVSSSRLERLSVHDRKAISLRSNVTTTRRGSPSLLSTTNNFIAYFSLLLLICTTGSSAVWWSPGSGSHLVESEHICQWARQVGGPTAELCRNEMGIIGQIRRGIELGIESCQQALQHDRWNCSQAPKPYFSQVMSHDIRETAFVHALTAAAITHEVTMACTRGKSLDCGCAVTAREKRRELLRLEAQKRNHHVSDAKIEEIVDTWEWGGCDDNIAFGYQKSLQLLNISTGRQRRNKKTNLKRAINAHNFEAGRLAVQNHMSRRCRCHGISGTCTLTTCWAKLPRFNEVRSRLRQKYDYAIRVVGNNDGTTLTPTGLRSRSGKRRSPRSLPASNSMRRPDHQLADSGVSTNSKRRRHPNSSYKRRRRGSSSRKIDAEDLLYTQHSPAFCRRSGKRGSLGTRGRQCDPTSTGLGSCAHLCCGRGYRSERVTYQAKCNCRFQYCCSVVCDPCEKSEIRHYCL